MKDIIMLVQQPIYFYKSVIPFRLVCIVWLTSKEEHKLGSWISFKLWSWYCCLWLFLGLGKGNVCGNLFVLYLIVIFKVLKKIVHMISLCFSTVWIDLASQYYTIGMQGSIFCSYLFRTSLGTAFHKVAELLSCWLFGLKQSGLWCCLTKLETQFYKYM